MNDISKIKIKKKLLASALLITFVFCAIVARLFYIQIVDAENLQRKATDQWTRDLPLSARRGSITDRNGVVVADTSTVYTIYVRPNALEKHAEVATCIADTLGEDYDKIYAKVAKKGVSEVTVAKKVTRDKMLKISQKNFKGVYFAQDNYRYYPYGDFMTQLLGFTNADGDGQSGVEQYYNNYLKGVDGRLYTETDLIGKELNGTVNSYLPAIDGLDVSLTVDYMIQSFCDGAVRDAMLRYNAKGASCIVMSPKTGEIYAYAQAPSFDLNNIPRDDLDELFSYSKTAMVTNVYEPGSTFKILTSAIGLEENAFPSSHSYYCPGYRIVDGQRIKCWRTIGHGSQNFEEGIRNSCNCVFMDIATKVGTGTMYDYFDKFGLTSKTGIDIKGEVSGLLLKESGVKNVDIARIGFGQAIAVTPIGLLTAVSSVINGGDLITPHIVGSVTDQKGKKVYSSDTVVRNKVISDATSQTMRQYLEGVVSLGSGKKAYVPGYKIGGKTGTAQKYENGAIASGKYISSFIGFAPADDPEYVCLMIVDEPQGYVYYGSIVAAPYVGDIFSDIFKYKGIAPSYTQEELDQLGKTFVMPDLREMSLTEAVKVLKAMGLDYEMAGESGNVVYQLPAAGAEINAHTIAFLQLG